MPWGQFITQWLHVFFAIVWFGGTVLMFAVIAPALRSADPSAAMQVGAQIGRRAQMVLGPAGGLTIIFGLLRATVFGPVKSWSFFDGSAYGMTLIAAIVLAVLIAAIGGVTGGVGASIATAPESERPKLIARIGSLTGLSVFGFILALTCMLLMRYGL